MPDALDTFDKLIGEHVPTMASDPGRNLEREIADRDEEEYSYDSYRASLESYAMLTSLRHNHHNIKENESVVTRYRKAIEFNEKVIRAVKVNLWVTAAIAAALIITALFVPVFWAALFFFLIVSFSILGVMYGVAKYKIRGYDRINRLFG